MKSWRWYRLRVPTRLQKHFIRRQAGRDARHGLSPNATLLVEKYLPVRPNYDPLTSAEDRQIAARLDTPELGKWQERVRHLEEELTKHTSFLLLLARLGLLSLGEVMGCALLMKDFGFQGPEQWTYAGLLTAFIFFLLRAATAAVTGTNPDGTKRRSPWTWIILGAVAALIGAVTALRLGQNEGDTRETIAGAILMAGTALGAGFLAEATMRKLDVVAPLWKEKRLVARRIKEALAQKQAAEDHIARTEGLGKAWDNSSREVTSTYSLAYRDQRAQQGAPNEVTS